VPQIGVTFEIDNNGILKVTAKDQGTGRDHSIVIQPSGGLTKDEINRMVNLAEQMKDQDKKKRVRSGHAGIRRSQEPAGQSDPHLPDQPGRARLQGVPGEP
jgi:molecular chaperone DnaK (HSP70)